MRLTLLALVVAICLVGCGAGSPSSAPATSTAKPAVPDTGRMSSGEFQTFRTVTQDFNNEASQFLGGVTGKCNNLAQLGELAAASDCYVSRYKGVDDAGGAAYGAYTDLIGATAKSCRKALVRLRSTLDQFTSALKSVRAIGENLETDLAVVRTATSRVGSLSSRYASQGARILTACPPA